MEDVTFEVMNSDDDHRVTIIELQHNHIRIKCNDPYGFWTIHYDKGQVPEGLRGQYTSHVNAMNALKPYLVKKLGEEAKKKVTKTNGSTQKPDGHESPRT